MKIPGEAVEAAAEALAVTHYEDDDIWQPGSHLSEVGRKRWRAEAIGVLMPAAHFIAAQALREAADQMSEVIATGDVAEVAAPVDGESGRQEAIWARDGLYEEPDAWLRRYAESGSDS